MTEDGALNVARVPEYAEWVAKHNITNVMPAGSNGESLSLTTAERKELAEAWAKAGSQHGLNVYMHVGSESLVTSVELARHAGVTPGIHGIVSMTPVYFKPTVQTLHAFLSQVAGAAPNLPFWYYHFPDDTGVLRGGAHELLAANAENPIPNLMGIKYTDYDLMDFQLCLMAKRPVTTFSSDESYNMLYGRDEMAISAMLLGAEAAVSSTVGYSPTLMNAISQFKSRQWEGSNGAVTQQKANARLCSLFG